MIQQVITKQISVKKRDGSLAPFDASHIEQAITNVFGGYESRIDCEQAVHSIVEECKHNLFEGISTEEINRAVILVMRSKIEQDPLYARLTSRFFVNDLYKQILETDEFEISFDGRYRGHFVAMIRDGVAREFLDMRLANFNLPRLAEHLSPSRDQLLKYMGMEILHDRYLLRDHENRLLELPQYFWMRIAMGLALPEEDKDTWAIRFYDVISQLLYVPSTPTLLHSGTPSPQDSSCFLSTVEDDLAHIFKSFGDNAQLSKWCGGIGCHFTNVRATNAPIKSIHVNSQGVVPFLNIFDASTAAINRSGKRRGAVCAYLETWHYDIEDFLELRKNTGDERRRTHNIDTANWIPDLFMKRVEADGIWTLFSPDETPDLHHLYGKAFEKRYAEYEQKADAGEIKLYKRVHARDLWRRMLTMLYETGHPWITFKDACNIRSPQDHVGVIHSSNLCTEITLNTSSEETAVCNLGSINLARHVSTDLSYGINKDLLEETIQIAVRMLDNVIDVNFYPTFETRTSNLRHRPIGLGVMGFQDALYMLSMRFDSKEAVNFSETIMEFISYHAILASSKLAREKGPYTSYPGSKWDRNIFPIDTIDLLEQERGMPIDVHKGSDMPWVHGVRRHVETYGMRNSNCLAIAPTATISNIAGCFPSIEPIYKNIYVKSNQSGEFTVLNEYLVDDLKELRLWDADMLEQLKYCDGDLFAIDEIPQTLKAKYKEAFAIDSEWVLRHAVVRGKWIDQSQSLNIFLNTVSGQKLSDVYMSAWKKGLKTTYYLRGLAASAIEKSTLVKQKQYEQNAHCLIDDPTCEACQ